MVTIWSYVPVELPESVLNLVMSPPRIDFSRWSCRIAADDWERLPFPSLAVAVPGEGQEGGRGEGEPRDRGD